MKKIDFKTIDRSKTYTTKYDEAEHKFGTADLLPLWVADMDLASPLCVQKSLQKRAKHPVYGYTVYPEKYYSAIEQWMQKRFDWKIKREWIVPCYGVVPSLNFAIEAYTKKGEGVMVQTPLYPPFAASVKHKKRILFDNTLVYKNGKYTIDFNDFEKKVKEVKLFLLCSPHNPTGRVWNKKELEKMIDICITYNVIIVSDEIHADIVYEKTHHIMAKFKKIQEPCVILNAPSKTFNIAGLNTSYAIIPNRKIRRKYMIEQNKSGISNGNPFGIEALIAAYNKGDMWLDALKVYLDTNITFIQMFINKHTLPMVAVKTEATFLVWLDCRKMYLNHEDLIHFFIHDAKLGLNDGLSFGKSGEGFVRLNIGTSQEVLNVAMNRILKAYKEKNV